MAPGALPAGAGGLGEAVGVPTAGSGQQETARRGSRSRGTYLACPPSGILAFPWLKVGLVRARRRQPEAWRPRPCRSMIKAGYVKNLLNDDVRLLGGVCTAQVRADRVMKGVGNDSWAALYRPGYAEWPRREISETWEKLQPREVSVTGGGPGGWSPVLCRSRHSQNNFCFSNTKTIFS